jgi:hypothetical protein
MLRTLEKVMELPRSHLEKVLNKFLMYEPKPELWDEEIPAAELEKLEKEIQADVPGIESWYFQMIKGDKRLRGDRVQCVMRENEKA